MLSRVRRVLRALFGRRRFERDMQEELSTHLDQAEARLAARGLTAEEARHAARREFGNLDVIQEEARDARGRWLESVLANVRFGLRHFARTPFSTLTMIVLLALGIGFNAALFTVIHSMLTQPPPGIERAETLVRIRGLDRTVNRGSTGREFSYVEYREYAAQRGLFSAVAAWTSADVVLATGDNGEELHSAAATYVTANYFAVLGVRPILGAGLPVATAVDDAGAPHLVAVISHALWDRHLGRAPDVLGRTVKVNGVALTIVGVAPRKFSGARTGGSQVRVWLPLSARALIQRSSASALSSYDSIFLGLAARLNPQVTASQTLPVVQAIAARAAQQTERWRASGAISTDVVTLVGDNYFPPSGEPASIAGRITTLFIPLLILLIPCVNVSALLVGLAVARRREIAVRLSLGAGRRRVVRQLITESVLLALAAAGLGLCVIAVLLQVFGARVPDLQLVLHWRAVAFTFAIALATGILFGLSPALHATRLAVSNVLKDAAAGVVATRSRLQSGLVVTQIALTQPLLLGLGALILGMISDLNQLPTTQFGDRILQVNFNTNARYGTLDQEREQVLQQVQSRIAGLPGVAAVVKQQDQDDYLRVAVHPTDRMGGADDAGLFWLRTQAAPPGFFELMGFPFLRGQGFSNADGANEQALVIRGDLARRLWGNADPIGRRLVHASANGNGATAFVVVGVVDESTAGESAASEQRAFVPASRSGVTGGFLVRTRGPAQPMIPLIRAAAQGEAPTHPVTGIRTLAALENQQRTLIARVTGGAATGGIVALLLCAIGLYAVVAFAVGQRTREIGIRTALGADPQRVAAMFFRRGLRLSIAGLLIGITLSIIVLRLMVLAQGIESEPESGITLLAVLVAIVVVGVAALATWIPARRAVAVDPLTALRAE